MTDSTAKQFDARFDALSRKLRKVDVEKIDACYDELADFLASDPAATIAFLGRCDAKRLKVAETVLESVADRVGDDAFVAALVAVQERLSEFEFDLTFALDAARIGAARRATTPGAKGQSPQEAYREVLAKADSGDSDAMFQVALRLYFGNGVARDVEAARAMATKALDSGNLAAAAIRDLP